MTTATQFITRKESITTPPNLYMRQVCLPGTQCIAVVDKQLTDFKDPAPQLRGIKKQLGEIQTSRRRRSFVHALPAAGLQRGNAAADGRLGIPAGVHRRRRPPGRFRVRPTALRRSAASRICSSLLQGYAVLDDTTMPVVGDPETVNDTFVKQIVDPAQGRDR